MTWKFPINVGSQFNGDILAACYYIENTHISNDFKFSINVSYTVKAHSLLMGTIINPLSLAHMTETFVLKSNSPKQERNLLSLWARHPN